MASQKSTYEISADLYFKFLQKRVNEIKSAEIKTIDTQNVETQNVESENRDILIFKEYQEQQKLLLETQEKNRQHEI